VRLGAVAWGAVPGSGEGPHRSAAGAKNVDVAVREATPADATLIATLHTESWRRRYRGAYADAYLDGEAAGERLELWRARLGAPGHGDVTLVAEIDGTALCFVHVIMEDDPRFGALVDNLHARGRAQRRGVGTHLLAAAGRAPFRSGHQRKGGAQPLRSHGRGQVAMLGPAPSRRQARTSRIVYLTAALVSRISY